jgi:hypothetical protein
MKEKNATLLSKDVAVKSWSGGALLYVPVDHENAPGQAQPGASIMALSNAELISLIAWKRQRDGARHAPDDLAEQIVAGLVNREISPRSAVEAIRWIESRAADGAIAGWIADEEDNFRNQGPDADLVAEWEAHDAERTAW